MKSRMNTLGDVVEGARLNLFREENIILHVSFCFRFCCFLGDSMTVANIHVSLFML